MARSTHEQKESIEAAILRMGALNSVRTEEPALQWHPAFFAGIQIELREEEGKVSFESEHQLGTKPMQIDVLINKKNSNEPMEKNIGRILGSIILWSTRVPKIT